jgi:tRNA(fMet)-specific endonuclease VapC
LILLDANTLIHYFKGTEKVVSRLKASSAWDVAIPSIVAYEVEFGSLNSTSSRRRELTAVVLEKLRQIPFDHDAAHEAARIRLDLEKRGLPIGELDLLIAGIAVSRGALLVTNNTREFSRVKGLRLADWTK